MRHYSITFKGYSEDFTKSLNYIYAYFSLPNERVNTLIPLELHAINIHQEIVYLIDSKIFDAFTEDSPVYRIKHNINFKIQVSEWLSSIGAQCILFVDKIQSTIKPQKYVYGVGVFEIEESIVNPKYESTSNRYP